nr:hypothetical protein KRP22_10655 [Phytophthora ramorum]
MNGEAVGGTTCVAAAVEVVQVDASDAVVISLSASGCGCECWKSNTSMWWSRSPRSRSIQRCSSSCVSISFSFSLAAILAMVSSSSSSSARRSLRAASSSSCERDSGNSRSSCSSWLTSESTRCTVSLASHELSENSFMMCRNSTQLWLRMSSSAAAAVGPATAAPVDAATARDSAPPAARCRRSGVSAREDAAAGASRGDVIMSAWVDLLCSQAQAIIIFACCAQPLHDATVRQRNQVVWSDHTKIGSGRFKRVYTGTEHNFSPLRIRLRMSFCRCMCSQSNGQHPVHCLRTWLHRLRWHRYTGSQSNRSSSRVGARG